MVLKQTFLIAIPLYLAIAYLFACAPSVTVTGRGMKAPAEAEGPVPDMIAKEIEEDERVKKQAFNSAERAYKEERIEKALELYIAFADTYPGNGLADDAIFRQGEIYLKRGEAEEAIGSFQKIITDYVGSDMFMEAKYRLSLAYFKRGDYNDTIQTLKGLLDSALEKKRRVAVITTIADSHLNLGINLEALTWYTKALDEAPGKDIRDKIKKRAANIIEEQLSPSELEGAPDYLGDNFIGQYAAYTLIARKVDAGIYEEAKAEIADFLAATEDNELKVKSEELLQVIVQRMDINADTIGCILPLTGKYALYGKNILRGVQLAAGVFGGGEGPAINLIIKDSKGDPLEAAKAVIELSEKDKVIAIIGPLVSDAAENAALVAQEKSVPMIGLSKKIGLPETGDYIFRNFLTDSQQTKTITQYAIEELGIKRFAVLYPLDMYGDELMNLFWNDVLLMGGEIVGIEGYDKANYDFGKEIKKLVGMDKVDKDEEEEKPEHEKLKPLIDFEAIFIPDTYEKAALIASHLVYNDVEGVILLGTNSWNSPKLLEIGGEYIRGALFPSGFYPNSSRKETQKFVKHFESAFGEKPGILEAMAYDATKMAVDAIDMGEAMSRVEVKNYLLSLQDFDGVTGKTTVTGTGDVEKELFLLTVKGKEIVEIERPKVERPEEDMPAEEVPLIQ